jgi:hypothetical protein
MFVDDSGRIGRLEVAGMVMVFSKYGEALSIVPPM